MNVSPRQKKEGKAGQGDCNEKGGSGRTHTNTHLSADARSTDVLFKTALSLSTTASPEEQTQGTLDKPWASPVSTHVYIQRGGVCGRGNTIASYSELNRHVSLYSVTGEAVQLRRAGGHPNCV